MKLSEFDLGKYMNAFEHKIVIPGLEQGLFGSVQDLPIWDNKLSGHKLRKLIGTRFKYEKPAIISYYDVEKRSTGFMAKALIVNEFMTIVKGHKVSFSSIKIEHIAQLDPELLECFAHFKALLVKERFDERTE